MELAIIEIDSPEWNYAWDWLAAHPINSGLEEPSLAKHPESGEAWQYMSSYYHNGKILHEFRHRNHPTTNKLEIIVLHGSNTFSDDQIYLRKKIR